MKAFRRIVCDVSRIRYIFMWGFRILRVESRLVIRTASARRDILINDSADAPFHIDTIMHAARSNDIASDNRTACIVVNIDAVVSAAVVDDIVEELHTIGTLAKV